MKIDCTTNRNCGHRLKARKTRQRAFSLVEMMMGLVIMIIICGGVYQGIAYALLTVRVCRESLEATQILQSKAEVIRMYNWTQVNTTNFVPTTFSSTVQITESTNSMITFNGTVAITPAPVTESYSNTMKQVMLTVTWQSGNVQYQRQMCTYISQYGMQNYIY